MRPRIVASPSMLIFWDYFKLIIDAQILNRSRKLIRMFIRHHLTKNWMLLIFPTYRCIIFIFKKRLTSPFIDMRPNKEKVNTKPFFKRNTKLLFKLHHFGGKMKVD